MINTPSTIEIVKPGSFSKDKIISSAKFLETIGRICHDSEERITPTSYTKFLKMLIKKGHMSVFEHLYTIVDDPVDSFPVESRIFLFEGTDGKTHVNIATLMEHKPDHPALKLWTFYSGISIEGANILSAPDNFQISTEAITLKWSTRRSITHQMVRNRIGFSYTQESTRYVAYKGDVKFSYPKNISPELQDDLERISSVSEKMYHAALFRGDKPEDARDLFPHCLNTTLYITAPYFRWKKYISSRKKGGQADHNMVISTLTENYPVFFP